MNMDLGIIIAIVGTGIAMVGSIISMMFWARQEANSTRAEVNEHRKDMATLVWSIQLEMKDFHSKLLNIEKSRSKR